MPDAPAPAVADAMSDLPAPGAIWRNPSRPQPFDLEAVPESAAPTRLHQSAAETDAILASADWIANRPSPGAFWLNPSGPFELSAVPAEPSLTAVMPPPSPLERLPTEVLHAILEHLAFDDVLILRQTNSQLREQIGTQAHLRALTKGWQQEMHRLANTFQVIGFMNRASRHLEEGWWAETISASPHHGIDALVAFPARHHSLYAQALGIWMRRIASPVGMDSGAAKAALMEDLPKRIRQLPVQHRPVMIVELILNMMVVDRRRRLAGTVLPEERSGSLRLKPLVESIPDEEAKKWLHAFKALCALDPNTFMKSLDDWVKLARAPEASGGVPYRLLQDLAHRLTWAGPDANAPLHLALPPPFVAPLLNALHEIGKHLDVAALSRHWHAATWLALACALQASDRVTHLEKIRQTVRRLMTGDAVRVLVRLTSIAARFGTDAERADQVGKTMEVVRCVEDARVRHALWGLCIDECVAQLTSEQGGPPDPSVAQAIFEGYMSWEPRVGEDAMMHSPPRPQALVDLALWQAPFLRLAALKRVFDGAPPEWLANPSHAMSHLQADERLTLLEWMQARVDKAPLDHARLRRLVSATGIALKSQSPGSARCFGLLARSLELLERAPDLLPEGLWKRLLGHTNTLARHLTGSTSQESEELAGRASRLFNAALSHVPPDDAELSSHASLCLRVALSAPKHDRAELMVAPWLLMTKPELRDIMGLLDEFETTAHPQAMAVLKHVQLHIGYSSDFWRSRPSENWSDEWSGLFSKTLACPGWKVGSDTDRLAFVTAAVYDLADWKRDVPKLELQPLQETLLAEIAKLCTSEKVLVREEAQALKNKLSRMPPAQDGTAPEPSDVQHGELGHPAGGVA